MNEHDEISILKILPDDGMRCMCFGHLTYCCKLDMEEEPDWHEVIFRFHISSYRIKKEFPENPEDSVLERYIVREFWDADLTGNDQPCHVIGVTKWKRL